jgi:hypothetical protein
MEVESVVLIVTVCLWMLCQANLFQSTPKRPVLLKKRVVPSTKLLGVHCFSDDLDDLAFESRRRHEIFLCSKKSLFWGLPNHIFNGYGASPPPTREKNLGCDDYSFLSNAGVQISGARPLFPPFIFMEWTWTT